MREDQDPYGSGDDIYSAPYASQPYNPGATSTAPTAGVQPYNPSGPQPVQGIVQSQTFDPNSTTRPVITPGMSGQNILQATNSYQPGYAPTTTPGTPTQQVASYVNGNDPTQTAVWQAFAAKGIQPRDQADFQYWVDKMNADPNNRQYWLNRMAQAQGGVGDYSNGGGSLGGASSSASGFGLFDPQTQAQIKQAFLARLGGLSKPITADDPAIAGAIGANRLTGQRALEEAEKAIAERNYAHGTLNTAGFGQQQDQARETEGAMEAQFAGNAVSQAQQQREQLLNQLLGIGGSLASGANNLQLGYDNLGYNYAGLQNNMNRDAILAALGVYGG